MDLYVMTQLVNRDRLILNLSENRFLILFTTSLSVVTKAQLILWDRDVLGLTWTGLFMGKSMPIMPVYKSINANQMSFRQLQPGGWKIFPSKSWFGWATSTFPLGLFHSHHHRLLFSLARVDSNSRSYRNGISMTNAVESVNLFLQVVVDNLSQLLKASTFMLSIQDCKTIAYHSSANRKVELWQRFTKVALKLKLQASW